MNPRVTVIVPTYNSVQTIAACLKSIKEQSYPSIELIVVDNHSTDETRKIARIYTDHVYTIGPERSAQRNYGVQKATGEYVCIIDSDMELSPEVISQCVSTQREQPDRKGIIIPEESFGQGFWAQCKKLERSFYVGVDWMEAARFFDKRTYIKLGGYDVSLVSGEDWDLSQRVAQIAPLGRIEAYIYHNEGRLKLGRTLGKKYYYARQFARYLEKQDHAKASAQQANIFTRYWLYLSHPGKLLRRPHVGIGMLFMKTLEFGAGAIGMVAAKREAKASIDG